MDKHIHIEKNGSRKLTVSFDDGLGSFVYLSRRETERLIEKMEGNLRKLNPLIDIPGSFGAYSEEIIVRSGGKPKRIGVTRYHGRIKLYLEEEVEEGFIHLSEPQARELTNLLKGYIEHYDWK